MEIDVHNVFASIRGMWVLCFSQFLLLTSTHSRIIPPFPRIQWVARPGDRFILIRSEHSIISRGEKKWIKNWLQSLSRQSIKYLQIRINIEDYRFYVRMKTRSIVLLSISMMENWNEFESMNLFSTGLATPMYCIRRLIFDCLMICCGSFSMFRDFSEITTPALGEK